MAEQSTPRQRFRSSCTHCAIAKVKCSTARPECARCQERGLVCSYALSNRYGRRPAGPIPGGRQAPAHATEALPTPPNEHPFHPCFYDPSSSFFDTGLNDWLPEPDTLCAPIVGGVPEDQLYQVFFSAGGGGNSVWNPNDLALHTQPVSQTHERGASAHAQSTTPPASQLIRRLANEAEESIGGSHNCLAQAARILLEARCCGNGNTSSCMDGQRMQDSSRASSARGVHGSLAEPFGEGAEMTMGDVIFTNRRILDQTTGILDCACAAAGDYQTLVVVSLIWFHLIDRGAVEAQGRPGGGVSLSVLKQLQGDLGRNLHNVSSRAEQLLQQV
ncbi:uncharacterized protein BDV14DRAFT_198346 [Aspergillus stella-maris]|uniref:uncharacterized protein n=1 Tax=Aspergillus stella-maris TaxID=1810926 RepID=UPI003CCD359B